MRPPRANPFRVDRVSALPFLGTNAAPLVDRLLILRRAAIVGPHGVGKSTLMRTIAAGLRERIIPTLEVALPGSATRRRRLDALDAITAAGPDTFVLLDGYEQLTWPERRRARRHPCLLVTAHRRTRLATLLTLRPTVATLNAVVTALGVRPNAIVQAAFTRHRGDVRETLMSLYDAWAAGEDF